MSGKESAFVRAPQLVQHIEKPRQAFYDDVPMDKFLQFAADLNPDAPTKAAADDGRGTVETLVSSHSPFACMSDRLSEILAKL